MRELSPADEDALARFFVANDRAEITRYFFPFPLTAETAERLCRAAGRDRYFVLMEGAEIAGLAFLRGWDEGYDVPSFGVLVDYRQSGQGHGSALLDRALEMARDLGSRELRLTVHPENAAMRRVAERLGFRRTGELPNGNFEMRVTV